MNAEGFTDQGAYAPGNLIAGEYPRIERLVTVTGAAALTVGSVLGRITADGKYQLSLSAAVNGSETPEAILAETIDTIAGDVEAVVYLAGEFNESALTLGAGHTLASISDGLRSKSIFLRANQPV